MIRRLGELVRRRKPRRPVKLIDVGRFALRMAEERDKRPFTVMPVQPVERPRDAEAVERVARVLAESEAYPEHPIAPSDWRVAERIVAALGPVERPCEACDELATELAEERTAHQALIERPCEVTDAARAFLDAYRGTPRDPTWGEWEVLEEAKRALEAALGAVVEGERGA